jgi:hypothetical protein
MELSRDSLKKLSVPTRLPMVIAVKVDMTKY